MKVKPRRTATIFIYVLSKLDIKEEGQILQQIFEIGNQQI